MITETPISHLSPTPTLRTEHVLNSIEPREPEVNKPRFVPLGVFGRRRDLLQTPDSQPIQSTETQSTRVNLGERVIRRVLKAASKMAEWYDRAPGSRVGARRVLRPA